MVSSPVLFLLLPALASCRITLYIQTFEDSTDARISWKGNFDGAISNTEYLTFGLTDMHIREALKKHDESIVYQKNEANFSMIKRILLVSEIKTLSLESETFVVGVTEFDGDDTATVNLNSILGEVDNFFEAVYLQKYDFNIEEDFMYFVQGAIELDVTSPWNKDVVRHKSTLFGDLVPDIKVAIKPGQTVAATLSTTKISQTFLVEYTAHLDGLVYDYNAKDQQINWFLSPQDILEANNLPTSKKIKQRITIQYHIMGNIVVMDKKANETLAFIDILLH